MKICLYTLFIVFFTINSKGEPSKTDNRVPSKTLKLKITMNNNKYDCVLSHFKWHFLNYSKDISFQKDGYYSNIINGLIVDKKVMASSLGSIPLNELIERIEAKIAINNSGDFGSHIVIGNDQKHFFLYYQEILMLTIKQITDKSKCIKFLLPIRRSATVVVGVK